MSYDIYGNNLKRGHCEVHPNVAEEYPCSLCQSHSQSYSQESNAAYEAQSLRNDLAHSNSYIESLKAELAKVTAERDAYKLALVEIESPVKLMRQRAKFEGVQINGVMAIALSNDANYLKDIATTVLRKQSEEL